MGGMRFNNFGLDPNQLAGISGVQIPQFGQQGPAFQAPQQMLPTGGGNIAAQSGLAPPLPMGGANPAAQSGFQPPLPQAQAQPMAQSGFQQQQFQPAQFNQQQFNTSQQQAFNAIPTGLTGAESALTGGALGATEARLQALDVSRGDINRGGQNALGQIQQGQQFINQGFGNARQIVGETAREGQQFIQGGINRGIQGLQQGGQAAQQFLQGGGQQAQGLLNQGVSAIQQGTQGGMDFLNQSFQQAVDPITGFIQPGQDAQQLLAARNGAFGPEAQAEAFRAFQQSPGLQFLAEEQERALVRNAAATGGTGGNRLRSELSRAAFGRAQSDLGRQDANLAGLSNQGLSAAQSVGSLRGQQGQLGSSLISQGGRDEANLRQTGAGFAQDLGTQQGIVARGTSQDMAQLLQSGAISQSEIVQNAGRQIAELDARGSLAGADLATKSAMIESATGSNLAQLAETTGRDISSIVENLGAASAGLRSQAGRDLASAIAESSVQLANLQSQQGAGISDTVGNAVNNIGNLLLQEGLQDAASQERQAEILGNIAVGAGSQASNIAQNMAILNAQGILGQSKIAQDTLGSLAESFGKSDFLSNIFNKDTA